MRALIKVLLTAIGLVLILIAVLLLLFAEKFRPVAETLLERELARAFGADVQLEGTKWALMKGGVAIRDLRVQNPEGFPAEPAFSCAQVTVWCDPLSLASRTPVLREVLIEGAEFHLRYLPGRGTNLGILADTVAVRSRERQAQGVPQVLVRQLKCDESTLRISPGSAWPISLPPFALEDVGAGKPIPPGQIATLLFRAAIEKAGRFSELSSSFLDMIRRDTDPDREPVAPPQEEAPSLEQGILSLLSSGLLR